MNDCKHENFTATTNVIRLLREETDEHAEHFMVELKVKCQQCGEPFLFLGFPFGYSQVQPTMSVDRQEARLPIAPKTLFDFIVASKKFEV